MFLEGLAQERKSLICPRRTVFRNLWISTEVGVQESLWLWRIDEGGAEVCRSVAQFECRGHDESKCLSC